MLVRNDVAVRVESSEYLREPLRNRSAPDDENHWFTFNPRLGVSDPRPAEPIDVFEMYLWFRV